MTYALYLAAHAAALGVYALGSWRVYEAGAGFTSGEFMPLARRHLEGRAICDLAMGVALSVAALCAWIFL